MLAVFQQWIADSRLTMRRDVGLLAVVVALITAACGGGVMNTPLCSTKACYAVAEYYTPVTDYAYTPQGAFDDVNITPMVCNSACVSEGGYIDNYLLAGNSTLDSYAEVGQTDEVFTGKASTPAYYMSAYIGGAGVAYAILGKGPSSDFGQTGDFSIHFINSACASGTTGLTESGTPCAATTTPIGFYYSVSVPSKTYALPIYFSGGKTIAPASVEFGEVLHGTGGEGANGVWWPGAYYPKLALSQDDVATLSSGAESSTAFPHSFINGGKDLTNNPPFGVWIGIEGDDFVWFDTWCCS